MANRRVLTHSFDIALPTLEMIRKKTLAKAGAQAAELSTRGGQGPAPGKDKPKRRRPTKTPPKKKVRR